MGWEALRARMAGQPTRRLSRLTPAAAAAAPPSQRLSDVVRPLGIGGLFWAPLFLAVLSGVAVASGGLRLLVRGIALVFGVFAALWRGMAAAWNGCVAAVKRLVAPVFAFTPATTVRDRPGDGRFHAEESKLALPEIIPPTPEEIARVRRAMAEVPEKGDDTLPRDVALLARLLADTPPGNDFVASDMVRDCFDEFGAAGIRSRALLAVAQRLARHFATPSHMPLATTRAWRMLDPATFDDEMAAQLAIIGRFISDWQKNQQTFLCLDFGEIELIEILFESIHPGRHAKEMTDVLNFKVLSNRRQGLLRRIPHRVRKLAQDPARRAEARDYVEATRAFLDSIATARHYQPIIDSASAALEEVNKFAEKMFPPAAQALPAPSGEGQALARITPVKMPASELAEKAIRESQPAAPAPASPPAVIGGDPATRPSSSPPPLAAGASLIPPVAIPAPAPSSVPSAPVAAMPVPASSSASPPAVRPRRGLGLGPRYSSETKPLKLKAGVAVVAARENPPSLSADPAPIRPGKRPPLPAFLLAPLPVLAAGLVPPPALSASPQPQPVAEPPKAVKPLTGRIALPGIGGKPGSVATAAPAVVRPAAPPPPVPSQPMARVATGTVARVPTAPADAPKATVTDLTVVPKSKRPPITQAIKRQSVLKVLRGESSSAIAASLGIREAKLDEWVDAFISAGAGALSPTKPKSERRRKQPEAEPLSAELLRSKLAEVLATAQMIEKAMEAQLSPRRPMLLPPPEGKGGDGVPKRPRRKG